jgi:DNA-binding ferritin-like protein
MSTKTHKTSKKSPKQNKHNRTQKNGLANPAKSKIIEIFLGMLNTVKLYHWKTYSYAQHKATDELYAKLNEHVDSFVEVLLGKDESRIHILAKSNPLLDYKHTKDFKARVYFYREFLIDMNKVLNSVRDTDLLNIRDEILGDINQFLYLMTFTK